MSASATQGGHNKLQAELHAIKLLLHAVHVSNLLL